MDPKIMERRAKEWMSIFREQAESGIGKDEWCSQNGVNRSNFYRWQRRCRELALLSQDENLPAPSLSSPEEYTKNIRCQVKMNKSVHKLLNIIVHDISRRIKNEHPL